MKRSLFAVVLVVAATNGHAQSKAESSAAILAYETALAAQVEPSARIKGFYFSTKFPHIKLDGLSRYDGPTRNTVHEALWEDVPVPLQQIFNQWAGYTGDYSDGRRLFHDMFYRFFFVHEFGHWLSDQVLAQRHDTLAAQAEKNSETNRWQYEMVANRISIAWWRTHDPTFLARLVRDLRSIEARLPSPVPSGDDIEQFFAANYDSLAQDPRKYGWYQLQMVIMASDEKPVATFQQAIDKLRNENYDK